MSLKPICQDILNHLGVCLVSESGHGKSHLAFSLVKTFDRIGVPVFVFSPSNIWLRKFGKISYITVGNRDYNPIIKANDHLAIYRGYSRDTIQINLDKKWIYRSNGWLEGRLASKQTTLFNIRYLNGRRIKYFIATALKHLYRMQSNQANPKPIIIVLEEAQNPFGTYSMNDDISNELQTVFTQSRSDANIHYIVIGQRLNDMSTKIVERLRPIIGFTIGQNSLRKIKAQLPKHLKHIPQELKAQTWLYLNGRDNPVFKSPRHKTEYKPIRLKIPQPNPAQINDLWRHSIPRRKPKKSLWQQFKNFIDRILLYPCESPKPRPIKISPLPTIYSPDNEDPDEDTELNAIMAETDQQDEEFFWT